MYRLPQRIVRDPVHLDTLLGNVAVQFPMLYPLLRTGVGQPAYAIACSPCSNGRARPWTGRVIRVNCRGYTLDSS
jgi:hypothetical protein